MSEEIFDVVNERDEVIGQAPRPEVHRLGLRHRAVHVLIFNARGEVFLQKRSMSKDTFPSVWDSSKVGVESFDNPVHFFTCRSASRAISSDDVGLVIGPPKEKRT